MGGNEILEKMFMVINKAENLKSFRMRISSPFYSEETAELIAQHLLLNKKIEELSLEL